jgi:hypothetical protein
MRSTPRARRLASQAVRRWRARASATQRPPGRVRPPLVATRILRAVAGPTVGGSGDEPLVVPDVVVIAAVGVGGVDEGEAGLERGPQDRGGPILVPIGFRRELHAAHCEPVPWPMCMGGARRYGTTVALSPVPAAWAPTSAALRLLGQLRAGCDARFRRLHQIAEVHPVRREHRTHIEAVGLSRGRRRDRGSAP